MEENELRRDVFNRLVDFKEQTGLSLNAFSGRIGMKQTTLHNQFHGKRDLSLETVINTLTAYSDLSAEWLMRGNGDMLISDSTNIISNGDIRIEALIDTIALLHETIKAKNDTIDALQAELSKYKRKSQKA
jgi:transcriptional regulator with XRE-family HTH domain